LEYLDLNLEIFKVLLLLEVLLIEQKMLHHKKLLKKLVSEELIGGGFGNTGNPIATATETVGGIELLNKIRSPLNVPQVPRGLIQR
jgi:hypothetical protein